jgi:hypothetical protein
MVERSPCSTTLCAPRAAPLRAGDHERLPGAVHPLHQTGAVPGQVRDIMSGGVAAQVGDPQVVRAGEEQKGAVGGQDAIVSPNAILASAPGSRTRDAAALTCCNAASR